jgi:hypothetical protein
MAFALGGCAQVNDAPSGNPEFAGRLLALSDTDMAATAYADGGLEPLPGISDTLALAHSAQGPLSETRAPNSVISWPQVLTVSPDGRFAYVVETRAAPPSGVSRLASVQDLPAGSRLTAFAILAGGLQPIAEADAGLNPQSVSLSGDGKWLAIASEDGGGRLILYALDQGRPAARHVLDLPLTYLADDAEKFPRSLAWSPGGDWLAVNVALRRIAFFELLRDGNGVPSAIRPHGAALQVGKRLSRGIWTADGRHYLVSDINAGPGALARVIGAPGIVTSIAFDAGDRAAHRIVSQAEVGGSPEGLALSPDQRNVATVNLERTFLPERWFLDGVPGRSRYSVNLLDFNPATGELLNRDRIHADGILPEDLVFDGTSRHLAVAVFHRRKGPDRRKGFIDFFSVVDGRLVAKGAPLVLPRGVHDIEALR